MANRSAVCGIAGQTYCKYAKFAYTTTEKLNVGYANSDYWVYILCFTTPAFIGKGKKLTISLTAAPISITTIDLRYALCTTDENYSAYTYTAGAVTEDSQLATGTLALTSATAGTMAAQTLEIDTDQLAPETTYYLYLWAANSNYCLGLVDAVENHTVSIEYALPGGVRIRTASEEGRLHLVAVHTSAGWKRHIPVVYTAQGWKTGG